MLLLIVFNSIFPQEQPYIPYVNEATIENLTKGLPEKYFIEKGVNIKKYLQENNQDLPHPFKKKFLSQVIAEVFKQFKLSETSKTLDKMKDLGFKYSTIAGIT